MTRKDYELIAAALKDARLPDPSSQHAIQHELCCKDVAYALQSDNPRFDRTRFLKACGLED